MPCPYDSGKRKKVSFYYRQVAGKPPPAPSGPLDCEDGHVRVRPIRLSAAEREESLPLSNLPESNALSIKRNARDNKDDSDDDDGLNMCENHWLSFVDKHCKESKGLSVKVI